MDRAAVRDHLLTDRREFVQRVLDCGRAIAVDWDAASAEAGTTTAERDRVVPPFRAALERAGLLESAPEVLCECVAAAGAELQASPVAAPPYVVVTSTGVVLRATLPDGRLVVRVEPFDVTRSPVRYRLRAAEPETAVSVERR